MSNTLEYILSLKDLMSSRLATVGVNSERALNKFARLEKQTNEVEKDMRAFGGSVGALRQKLNLLRSEKDWIPASQFRAIKKYSKEIDSLEKQIDRLDGKKTKSGGGGGLFGMMGRRFAPAALAAGALAFGTSSVQAAMNFGATTKSFEVLTGSAQKGRDLANSLNDLQQKTILGPEVFKSAQTLMSFGITAEKVMGIEKQLGDVSMGNKERFNALTLAFSQTHAAGRLMGQDLLQYINAGFNPLQVMSERWKEFGLKQKTSIGQLKEMMEEGKVSSAAVAKAFELATSKGGKFNNMMDAIAQTSYGKMQILEGSWENLKIQAGNALMPLAEGLMDVAGKTIDWLNITKTAPQVLMEERSEINSLLGVVTGLNQGNDLRTRLMQQLIAKYPDLFKNIDAEKTSNSELLSLLDKVNDAYQKRIGLATSGLIVDENTKSLREAQGELTRASTIVELLKRSEKGDSESAKLAYKMMNVSDNWNVAKNSKYVKDNYQAYADKQAAIVNSSNLNIAKENQNIASQKFFNSIDDAYKLAHDPKALDDVFGKDTKRKSQFLKLSGQITKTNSGYNTAGGGLTFADKLNGLISPPSVPGAVTSLIGGGKDDEKKKGKSAQSVATGGQKNVTVNLSIAQMAQGWTLKVDSLEEGVDKFRERIMEEMTRGIAMGAALGGE